MQHFDCWDLPAPQDNLVMVDELYTCRDMLLNGVRQIVYFCLNIYAFFLRFSTYTVIKLSIETNLGYSWLVHPRQGKGPYAFRKITRCRSPRVGNILTPRHLQIKHVSVAAEMFRSTIITYLVKYLYV